MFPEKKHSEGVRVDKELRVPQGKKDLATRWVPKLEQCSRGE